MTLLQTPTTTPKTILPILQKTENRKEKRALIFWKQLFDNVDLWEKRYKRAVVDILKDQEKEVLSRHTNKAFEEWTPQSDPAKWVGVLAPLSEEVMKDQAKIALEFANDDQTQFEITQDTRNMLEDRITKFANDTDEETRRRLQESITEGVMNGENNAKLTERVRDVYRKAEGYRANRISRTETAFLSSEASLESYRQSPFVSGKEWLSEPDACEFCATFDGLTIGLEDSFSGLGDTVVGQAGGELTNSWIDVDAPPLHPNCRCALLPVSDRRVFENDEGANIFGGVEVSNAEANFLRENNVGYSERWKIDETLVGKYNRDKNTIFVYNKQALNLQHTIRHELAHAVDKLDKKRWLSKNEAFAAIQHDKVNVIVYRIASENGMKPEEVLDAIHDANKTGNSSFLDYLSQDTEVFADGYAQFRDNPTKFKRYAPELYKIYKDLL